jgi:hypothetical protein
LTENQQLRQAQPMQSTLEELLAFRAVVDTGSITAAALQLDQTTSGISRSLSRLEKNWPPPCCAAPRASWS